MAGQPSFLVHGTVTLVAMGLACYFRFDVVRWMVLLLCIGLVLTAELLNSAIEMLFRELPEAVQSAGWPALDVAAGAVLVASIIALIIGILLFLPGFMLLLGWP